jgi:hypothetical protein
MTPEEKEALWVKTIQAAQAWDPRFVKAVAAALVLRHGVLKSCTKGCHTLPTERISLDELLNVVDHYNIGLRSPEYGIIEITAIGKDYCGNDQITNSTFDH